MTAPVAVGTSFALRLRGPTEAPPSPEGVVEEALGLGAGALVLTEGLPGEMLAPIGKLALRRGLPVVAVDGQLGAVVRGRPGLGRAHLCAEDREEARAAEDRTAAALELGANLGARSVPVTLGAVRAVAGRWDGLRRRFLRGELALDPEPAERLMADRRAHGARALEQALRGLERLAVEAERRGLWLLVRNPRRAIDLPEPLELRALLEQLRGAPVAPLLDVPAAHLASAMRLTPLRESVLAFSPGPLCLLGDACGAVGALAPGQGEVDVAAIARHLGRETELAFVPWRGLRLSEVRRGLEEIGRLAALPRRAE